MPDEIRQKIRDTHDRSFVVIAGAGTGKTTLLIDKLLSLLRSGRVSLNELAAITFTEKAAAEIGQRLRDKLDEAIARGDDAEGRLSEARNQLEGAAITTLHGFAGRLLRERPVEAGLPPEHQVQDPTRSALLFDEVYERWESEQLSQERPAWQRVLEHRLDRPLRGLASVLARNQDVLQDARYPLPPPIASLLPAFLETTAPLCQQLEIQVGFARDPDQEEVQQTLAWLHLLSACREGVSLTVWELINRLEEHGLRTDTGNQKGWRDKTVLKEFKANRKALLQAFLEMKRQYLAALAHDGYRLVQDFLGTFQREKLARGVLDFDDLLRLARDLLRDRIEVRRFFQKRYRMLLVDEFQDTDPLQAEMLCFLAEEAAEGDVLADAAQGAPGEEEDGPPPIGQAEDAFSAGQDIEDAAWASNPTASAVSPGEPPENTIDSSDSSTVSHTGTWTTDWKKVRLTPGKLFIVGDPKQSIYRFRRADVDVFQEVQTLVVEQGGELCTLRRNFRSLSGVVHFVNNFFAWAMLPEPGAERYQATYEALRPERQSPLEEPRVELLIEGRDCAPTASAQDDQASPSQEGKPEEDLPDQGASGEAEADDAKSDAAQRRVAELLASRLAQMLGGERLVCDKRGELQPVRPGHVAILFRSTTHLDLYTNALRDRDIPFRVLGSKRFYEAPEIVDLANLLRAVAAPHDTLALVGALRSPAFSFSDTDITALARAGALDYRVDPGLMQLAQAAGAALEAQVQSAWRTLRQLHALRDRIPLAALVGEALRQTSLWAVGYASFGGEQKALNLEKVRNLARAHEAAGMRSLLEFTESLMDAIRGRPDEEEASAAEEGDDVVRLMTIHKAKGLEWPVVFLPDLQGSSPDRPALFLEDRRQAEFSFQLGKLDSSGNGPFQKDMRVAPSNYETLRGLEGLRLKAEAIRLFYVATTRARDYLVLCGVGYAKEQSSLRKKLLKFLGIAAPPDWANQTRIPLDGRSDDQEIHPLEEATLARPTPESVVKEVDLAASRRSLIELVEQVDRPETQRYRPEVDRDRAEAMEHWQVLTACQPPPQASRDAGFFAEPLEGLLRRTLTVLLRQPALELAGAVEQAAYSLTLEGEPVPGTRREEVKHLLGPLSRAPILRRLREARRLRLEVPLGDGRRLDGLVWEAAGLSLLGWAFAPQEQLRQRAVTSALIAALQDQAGQLASSTGRAPGKLLLVSVRTGACLERSFTPGSVPAAGPGSAEG